MKEAQQLAEAIDAAKAARVKELAEQQAQLQRKDAEKVRIATEKALAR